MDPTGPIALARRGMPRVDLAIVLPWMVAVPVLLALGTALGMPLLAFSAAGFAFGAGIGFVWHKAQQAGKDAIRTGQHTAGQRFFEAYVAAHHGFADLPETQRQEATARLAGRPYDRVFLWKAADGVLRERLRALGSSFPPGGVPVYLPVQDEVRASLDRLLATENLPPLGRFDHHWAVSADWSTSAHQRLAARQNWLAIAPPPQDTR